MEFKPELHSDLQAAPSERCCTEVQKNLNPSPGAWGIRRVMDEPIEEVYEMLKQQRGANNKGKAANDSAESANKMHDEAVATTNRTLEPFPIPGRRIRFSFVILVQH